MPKTRSSILPYELLAFVRTRIISLRTLQILYLRSARLIARRSRAFLITAIPAVRRQLRWAMLLALLRTYFLFMRRVILDPRSGFEKTINKHGAWVLIAALRERFKARLRAKEPEGVTDSGVGGEFVTPPTSPAGSASSSVSYASVPDYFLQSPTTDPILRAVQQVIPDAIGYKVIIPHPSSSTISAQENASNVLAKRISGKTVETKTFYPNGAVRSPQTSESGRSGKIISLVIMEDMGERKSVRGAVTVDTGAGKEVETSTVEELGVSFAEALAC